MSAGCRGFGVDYRRTPHDRELWGLGRLIRRDPESGRPPSVVPRERGPNWTGGKPGREGEEEARTCVPALCFFRDFSSPGGSSVVGVRPRIPGPLGVRPDRTGSDQVIRGRGLSVTPTPSRRESFRGLLRSRRIGPKFRSRRYRVDSLRPPR